MSTAGPEDEPPGDELEGVRYFDFTDPFAPGPSRSKPDPFASFEPLAPSESAAAPTEPRKRAQRAEQADSSAFIDPFEYALSGAPPKLTRAESTEAEPAEDKPAEGEPSLEDFPGVTFFDLASLSKAMGPEHEARERFTSVFDAARADDERPFLTVALRIPAEDLASEHFPTVVQAVRLALGSGDALLADEDRLRLVVALPGRSAADARALFAQLKDYLREQIEDADDVLHAIAALVVPDGRPFRDAAEFLAHAYDNGDLEGVIRRG